MSEQPEAKATVEPKDRYQAEKDAVALIEAEVIRLDTARMADAMIVLPERRDMNHRLLDGYAKSRIAIESLLTFRTVAAE